MHLAESSSTLFCLWTGLSLPVALHPASQRRSYLQLRTGQCSRPVGTFTLLLVRTFRRTFHAPLGPAVWTFAGPSTALDRGYSGSGRGSLNHGGVADHIGWRAPTCLNLFAQKCHRVLTGRAPGGVAPLWE